MKTTSLSSPISPTVILLAVVFAAIVYLGVATKKVPLLSNPRVDIVLLVIIGMAICSQGGIGRVATAGQWLHPLSIVGYVLGGLLLFIALAAFIGWKLPLIQTEQQALLAIAVIAGVKVLNAVLHSAISPKL